MSTLLIKKLPLVVLISGLGIFLPSCESRSKKCSASTSASIGSGKAPITSRQPRSARIAERNYASEAPVDEINPGQSDLELAPHSQLGSGLPQVEKIDPAPVQMAPVQVTPVQITPAVKVKPIFKDERAGKARKDIMVTANSGDQIIVADDDNVTVTGKGGIVMISGRCVKLKLESNETEVYCDIANEIQITGDGNAVTLGTIGKGVVSGNNNKMTWESSFEGGVPPKIESTGQGNVLQQRPM